MQAPHASEADVDAAVASAKEAFAGWAATPIEERKAIMLKAHDALKAHSAELLELLVTEQGKPMDAAEAEFNLSLDNIKTHATTFELPVEDLGTNETHKTVVLRKPVGVVAGITPCAPFHFPITSPPAAHPPLPLTHPRWRRWNFPIFCAVQKWAPAITCGNSFVLKPSPMTPMTSLRIGRPSPVPAPSSVRGQFSDARLVQARS